MDAVGLIILALLGVIGAFVLAFAIYIRACHYLLTYRAVRQMCHVGRCLSRAEFEQYAAASIGTVVFEYPTPGWRVLRVWWTADDALSVARAAAISEVPPDSSDVTPTPLESWCHDNYTDLQSGRALIVPLYLFGAAYHRFPYSLMARFPHLRIITVRSAIVQMIRDFPDAA